MKSNNTLYFILLIAFSLYSCKKDKDIDTNTSNDSTSLLSVKKISETDLGEFGASEISAYCIGNKKLFVVDNQDANNPKVDVLDLSDPSNPKILAPIDLKAYGAANSVATKNGVLAIACQAPTVKTNQGHVVLLKTDDLSLIKTIPAGILPDMVTFTYDGKYILTANEGEPNDQYTIDPNGSISIIDASTYDVVTLDFVAFESQKDAFIKKGMHMNPNTTLAKDLEPEYIAISKDSKKAYISLQENNGIAVVDIAGKKIENLLPLGYKDFSKEGNEIDPSNKDDKVEFRKVNVKALYQPDALASFSVADVTYLITANEGDPREYAGYVEEKRVGDMTLDPTKFPNAAELKKEKNLGVLNVSSIHGDTDNDGDVDELIGFGARSFSIWDTNGNKIYDCGNKLEKMIHAAGLYVDKKSDNKGIELEGVTTGVINGRVYAFAVAEKANALAVIEITNPSAPKILSIIPTGKAPEGVLFIPKDKSPNDKALIIVCSEKDGLVTVFSID